MKVRFSEGNKFWIFSLRVIDKPSYDTEESTNRPQRVSSYIAHTNLTPCLSNAKKEIHDGSSSLFLLTIVECVSNLFIGHYGEQKDYLKISKKDSFQFML